MNQRKSTTVGIGYLIAAIAVVLVLVIVGLLVFVLDGDDDKKPGTPTGQGTLAPKQFAVDGVPFTFAIPGNFAAVDPPAGFVWIGGIGPYDIIDVKRLANEERTLKEAKASVKQSLQVRPDLTILGEGTETAGGVKMVTFTVDTTVEGQVLHSNLYYFSLAGASWQLECQSQQTARAAIDAACSQALTTFTAK